MISVITFRYDGTHAPLVILLACERIYLSGWIGGRKEESRRRDVTLAGPFFDLNPRFGPENGYLRKSRLKPDPTCVLRTGRVSVSGC